MLDLIEPFEQHCQKSRAVPNQARVPWRTNSGACRVARAVSLQVAHECALPAHVDSLAVCRRTAVYEAGQGGGHAATSHRLQQNAHPTCRNLRGDFRKVVDKQNGTALITQISRWTATTPLMPAMPSWSASPSTADRAVVSDVCP